MGCYLSKPITEKISEDDNNDKLYYGASSMQGWRVTQEDAHNCILDYDKNTSFFAVYDGHGGHEVAQYCSKTLPDYIKNLEEYKSGSYKKALEDGFLGFDETIVTDEVMEILKQIALEKQAEEASDDEVADENVENLKMEATMPIEDIIEKYKSMAHAGLKNIIKGETGPTPKSPFLKAKKIEAGGSSSNEVESSVDQDESSTSSKKDTPKTCIESKSSDEVGSSSKEVTDKGQISDSSSVKGDVNGAKLSSDDSDKIKMESDSDKQPSKEGVEVSNADIDSKGEEKPEQNGSIPNIMVTSADDKSNTDETDKAAPTQNGDISKEEKIKHSPSKGKGKALAKKRITPTPVKVPPQRNAKQLYNSLLALEDGSEESEDEEDQTFVHENADSDEEEDGVNVCCVDDEEEESSEEEEDEDDSEDEADAEDDPSEKEEPGMDSGCTAVVALLKDNELYVANAGDSRCIVCRNGQAVEMSIDHKPEDEKEKERIEKAGSVVTEDGRVNGGLNLSRAIGDHTYKKSTDVPMASQAITALPDVKTLTLTREDEFMVLACDGIWNLMSSQEVVDFVKPRLEANPDKLSQICEEMFDHCLSPDLLGDGTGCDNMTGIIVKFTPNIFKRTASDGDEEEVKQSEAKRAKTDIESTTTSSNTSATVA